MQHENIKTRYQTEQAKREFEAGKKIDKYGRVVPPKKVPQGQIRKLPELLKALHKEHGMVVKDGVSKLIYR
jgi:hypothetical protein